jgi:CheY-like chemotaxis protein
MAAKRALVVDDSRSARVILSRMLEVHGMQVDTAESGEQALEYLNDKKPDVVFMDHLMPGMDGFETIRAIKRDARTATIPVMMYTSQEGEAYLREARSLGAAGVLSKTLMPADVARALYQLKLLPDRRDMQVAQPPLSATVSQPLPTYRPSVVPPQSLSSEAPPPRDALTELKRSLEASLEQAARRIGNELRSTIQLPPQLPEATPTRSKTPRALIAALVVFALLPMMVSAILLWNIFQTGKMQLDQANARLGIVVAEQQAQIEALRNELRKRGSEESNELSSARTEIVFIPYGEAPLTGSRVEHIKKTLERLQAEGFKGRVRVEYFSADFCLTRGPAGMAPASPESLQRKCDLIGNAFDDALTAGQRQSNDYVGIVTNAAQVSRGAIQITTLNGGRKQAIAYPPQTDTLTAGAWNQAAARNQRLEITTEPILQSSDEANRRTP